MSFQSLRNISLVRFNSFILQDNFTQQGCHLCLKLFDSSTSQSEHKNTCCLSAPTPMCITMMPCAESKSDINLSNEDHVGAGLEAIALDCEMVWGGSDGSLDLCARVPDYEDENIIFHTYIQSGLHDLYVDCVSVMRLYKRFRALDYAREGNQALVVTTCAKDVLESFESLKTTKLEEMAVNDLYEISTPKYRCWCLDLVQT
ncbi:RNA exonuclease 4 [Pyrus ussuriensis x Pyrus communis]|uniref:RNA exonuclease 4 n=1 Tax=Pyrus ussuriensis x Pyrus communis TaxID=2448454 RepID=A0A5N5FZ93_9ROSA|nr:RNA exonuclease 4 [Pyrus ussuriensis x Pyrus communis]